MRKLNHNNIILEKASNAFSRNLQLSQEILAKYELDKVEISIVLFSGLLSSLVDTFCVNDVRVLRTDKAVGFKPDTVNNLRDAGIVNKFLSKTLSLFHSTKLAKWLETTCKVPYDRTKDPDVLGLNHFVHRAMSPGHSPDIFGFLSGIKDIMKGQFTVIDNSGKVIVKQIGEPISFIEALFKQVGHLLSDIGTPSGLPYPFLHLFMRLDGESPIDGMSWNRLAKNLYLKGYNFNVFLAQCFPVIFSKVLVSGMFLMKLQHEGYSLSESFIIMKNNYKLKKMLFISEGILSLMNLGKFGFTGNVMALNPNVYYATAKSSLPVLKTWLFDDVETERHNHVMEYYKTERNALKNKYKNIIYSKEYKQI